MGKSSVGRAQALKIEKYAKAVAGANDDLDPALEAAAVETLLSADDDRSPD